MSKQIWLTVEEVAKLYDISNTAIRMKILRGSLNAIKMETNKGCGFEYRINLHDLSETAKVKYYATQKEKNVEEDNSLIIKKYDKGDDVYRKKKNNSVDKDSYKWGDLSDKQKEKAYLWEGILRAWREFVDEFDGKETDATDKFITIYNKKGDFKISQRTLYRKLKTYNEKGLIGLADYRGVKNTTGNEIPNEAWEIFSNWYLDAKKPTVAFLYKALVYHFEMEKPDILPLPSETTFRRAIESRIPESVIKYFREGKKVWTDECAYYLRRDYSLLNSNDIWTSDYHTLDLFVKDDITGEVFRPHLVIWADIKSRKVLGVRLRRSSDSHGVFCSIRESIKTYGAPEMVYLDNGREFLSSDIGGRGRRKTDISSDYGKTLFDRLGIKMINAKVANGRAKIAERQFNTMSNQFSRMIETYCGNRPENRPENHLDIMKNDRNIPLLSEIESEISDYIFGLYNNEKSKAEGLENDTPNNIYGKYLVKKRVIPDEQVDMLLLRTSKLQMYKRNGVYVSVGSTKVYFYNSDLTMNYLGKKVYVRYDPDDLSEVMLEDENGVYIGKAQREVMGGYGLSNDVESIKFLNKTNKKLERIVKNYKAVESVADMPTVRDVVSKKSKMLMAKNNEEYYAKIIEPILSNNEYKKAVGAENINADLVDFDRMIENAKKNRK